MKKGVEGATCAFKVDNILAEMCVSHAYKVKESIGIVEIVHAIV